MEEEEERGRVGSMSGKKREERIHVIYIYIAWKKRKEEKRRKEREEEKREEEERRRRENKGKEKRETGNRIL